MPGHGSYLAYVSQTRLTMEPSMSRFAAPFGFTLAAVWVVVVFVLVSATP